MLVEQGQVLAVDASTVWVRVFRQSACSACGSNTECGNGVMDRLLGQRASDIKVGRGELSVSVGDRVDIGIPDNAVLAASVLAYGVPLLALVVGAVLGSRFDVAGSDTGSMIAGLLGLGGGWWLARLLGAAYLTRSEPRLLGVQPALVKSSN